MQQIFQNPKSGELEKEEITPPTLKAGGVLVRNRFSLISAGTERGIVELSQKSLIAKAQERPDYVQKFIMLIKTKGIKAAWQVAQSKLGTSIALGYSSAGEVVEVGGGVENLQAGNRVACAGQNYASHAEIIFVPKNLCVKIPDNVADEDAAFTTVGAIALQGIRRANLTPGETVGVIGLGLLGQLATKMLRAYGHPVIGFDIDERQIAAARQNGLEETAIIGKDNIEIKVRAFTNGRGVDAAIIYASADSDAPLKLAVEISRDKGRIVQVGNIVTNIPWRDFYKKELQYLSSCSYGPGRYDAQYEEGGCDYPLGLVRWTEQRNMEEFLRLLSDKKINIKDLITQIFKVEDADKAYEMIFDKEKLVRGLLLSYNTRKEQPSVIQLKNNVSSEKKDFLNVGFISPGAFATSTALPHLKEIKNIKLSAISGSNGKQIKDLGEKWGVDYVASDYRKILEDKNIDVVICTSRHSRHAQIVKEALALNKNIFIEKPMCVNETELNEIMEVAKKSKGRLMVGFNRRYCTHFTMAKKEFSNSNTPLMILYRVNFGSLDKDHWTYDLKEGGRIIGECCHFIDSMQYLTGSTPKSISASVIPVAGAIAHEENVSITIEYANGSIGTIFYSALGNFRLPKEYIEIYGDGKIFVIDNFKKGSIVYANKTKKANLHHQNKGASEEFDAFFDAIRDGKPSPMSLEEIYTSHRATFKAVESSKERKTINF